MNKQEALDMALQIRKTYSIMNILAFRYEPEKDRYIIIARRGTGAQPFEISDEADWEARKKEFEIWDEWLTVEKDWVLGNTKRPTQQ